MITFSNVSFRYDDELDENKYALKDVSLEVRSGEFACVIGQNGSGKSTLSKLINAIYSPTSGKVYVGGMDTSDPEKIWDIRKKAGMVFQNPDNQMVATIVEEDVAFGAENLGVPAAEIRERVNRALSTVGMLEHRLKSPEQLSGGQKQRIAIAGILAMEPECIVFDESTAMLDPSGRKEVMDVISQLHSRGMTVILVTHHMDEAVRADKVFVMDSGSVVMSGHPRDIFRHPDELRRLKLDIPFSVYASLELQKRGIPIALALTPDELAGEMYKIEKGSDVSKHSAGRAGIDGSEGGLANAYREECFVAAANVTPDAGGGHSAVGPDSQHSAGHQVDLSDDAIRLENLSHIYDAGSPFASPAISNINLRIDTGQLVGIIGHTGSGKTTLIQHFNGLLKPTEGKIVVAGLQIADETPTFENKKKRSKPRRKELVARQKNVIEIRKKVGLVFQYPEYQLFEETVEKDILFGPLNLGVEEQEARRRVRTSMEQVGLDYDTYAGRSPFELSGGQKRRVAIAGVLAMEPDVLILDEPTAGLDPQGRDDLLGEIRRLHREKKTTILIVSHSMDDMAGLAERILVVSKGKIVLDGTPKQVFSEEAMLREVGLDVPEVCKTLRMIGADASIISPAEGVAELERWLLQRGASVQGKKEGLGGRHA